MEENARHSTVESELAAGNAVTYFTVGVSMRPLLRERKTHVTIAPIQSPKKGDILLYIRKNGALVLHRLIKQEGDNLFMRGDNTYGLERISREQAIGAVTHIWRKGKLFDVKSNKKYLIYISFWNIIYPLRLLFFKLKSIARSIFRWLKKK